MEQDKILEEMMKMKIGPFPSLNDCFSATYNRVKFLYADMEIYDPGDSDSGPTIYFKGPLLIFNQREPWNEEIYISTKQKVLFITTSVLDRFTDCRKCNEIKLQNSILNEKIMIKSNGNPSIIENPSFQELINKWMNEKNYTIIYRNNKVFILIDNHNDSFENEINNFEEETKAREKIRNDLKMIQEELDKIIMAKDLLNIQEEI